VISSSAAKGSSSSSRRGLLTKARASDARHPHTAGELRRVTVLGLVETHLLEAVRAVA